MARFGRIELVPDGGKFLVSSIVFIETVTYQKEFETREEAENELKRLRDEMMNKL